MNANHRKRLLQAVSPMYPFSPKRFQTRSGHGMSYLDEGQGPALLLVHGNPSWSFYWREMVLAMRGHRRVIVPDHVGCGLSDRPRPGTYGFTLKERLDDLADLIAHTGLHQAGFDMAVHDWGGAIGVGAAAKIPDALRRLVITNTALFPMPPSRTFRRKLRFARSVPGRLLIRSCNAFAVSATRLCTVRPLPPPVKKAYTLPYSGWRNSTATSRFVEDIPLDPKDPSWTEMVGIEEFMGALHKPTLLLWGMKDFVFDATFFEEFRKRLPEAPFCTFPNAGHYLMEDAGPEVVSQVDVFLQTESDDAAKG